jgi:hypothetical protein
MLDATGPTCAACGAPLERVRYFPRQLITADDMRAEQHYFRERIRRHNRFLHGFGVVCGCQVVAAPAEGAPWQVQICPGYVVSPQGEEILVPDPVMFDLQTGVQDQDPCKVARPCPPQPVGATANNQQVGYICVAYAECVTRPVRVHPAGCGCDQLDCEYSRIRDSYQLKLLWTLPASHTAAKSWDTAWAQTLQKQRELIGRLGLPVPPCMECSDDPWVVLATVTIPPTQGGGTAATKTPIASSNISFLDRRVLLSTEALQVMTETFAGI